MLNQLDNNENEDPRLFSSIKRHYNNNTSFRYTIFLFTSSIIMSLVYTLIGAGDITVNNYEVNPGNSFAALAVPLIINLVAALKKWSIYNKDEDSDITNLIAATVILWFFWLFIYTGVRLIMEYIIEMIYKS